MILRGWVSDAERLMAELPPSAVVTERISFLIGAVLSRGNEVDPAVFDTETGLSAESPPLGSAERAEMLAILQPAFENDN